MTLDDIRAEAGVFPTWLVDNASTAACFFCAGFLGRNAEIYLLDTYATVLGFDTDAEKVAQMRELYPRRYIFNVEDAYAALDRLIAGGRRFGVVTVDPPCGEMFRAYSHLERWRTIGRTVILGVNPNLARMARCDGAVEIVPRVNDGSSLWAVFHA